MKIRREKKTLVIDWGEDEKEWLAFNKSLKKGYPVFMLPSRKRHACVYGFTVFSEQTTAHMLSKLMQEIVYFKRAGHKVYVSSQARTIFKRSPTTYKWFAIEFNLNKLKGV